MRARNAGFADFEPDERGEAAFSRLRVSSLAEEVANELYDAVVDGRLKPGSRLSEAALARSLGISRGPIREAQRILERRGLLRFEPRRGFFVRSLSVEEVEDLFGVREQLERYAVRLACERSTDKDLAGLQAWKSRMQAESRTESEVAAGQLVEVDLGFHRMICQMTRSETLISLYETVLSELRIALAMINLGYRQQGKLVRSHGPVVEALLARNAEAAQAAVSAHLNASLAMVRAKLASAPAGKDEETDA
jgi:DNA-binding GntR family transcriptional regulator